MRQWAMSHSCRAWLPSVFIVTSMKKGTRKELKIHTSQQCSYHSLPMHLPHPDILHLDSFRNNRPYTVQHQTPPSFLSPAWVFRSCSVFLFCPRQGTPDRGLSYLILSLPDRMSLGTKWCDEVSRLRFITYLPTCLVGLCSLELLCFLLDNSLV